MSVDSLLDRRAPNSGPEVRTEKARKLDFTNNFTLVGDHVYTIGQESGDFAGRWNGIWNLPIKVADSANFGISTEDGKPFWLHHHCKQFNTGLSEAKRTYEIQELGVTIREILFIPENENSVCWRFSIKNTSAKMAEVNFVSRVLFDFMWEVKTPQESWKERKTLFYYDPVEDLVIARDRKHSDWVGVFGSGRQSNIKSLGQDDVLSIPNSNLFPGPLTPRYGNAVLTHSLAIRPQDTLDIDVALTGGVGSLSELIQENQRVIKQFASLRSSKYQLYNDYLTKTVDIDYPRDDFVRSYSWSKINLQLLKHYQNGFGRGYFAGYPHFAIYFGRDTAWTSFGATSIGDFEMSRDALNLLARFQASQDGEDAIRAPYYVGEIPHEIRTEGTVYYYSIDSTPLFIIAIQDYIRWSNDYSFLRFIYPNIEKAVSWCISADRDGDGLIEHGPKGFLPDTTWMDSIYRGKSAVDVQAIFAKAFESASYLANLLDDHSNAKKWRAKSQEMRDLLVRKYWDESTRFLSDSISSDGSKNQVIAINAVIPVLFGLIQDSTIVDSVLSRVESEDFMTDWGVRTRARSDVSYDPRSYQEGGVWPFCTGWVAQSEFNCNRFEEGILTIGKMITGLDMGSNYFKEVLFGDLPPTGSTPVQPTGCFIQAWSASIFVSSIIQGLFGVKPIDDCNGIRIRPFLEEESNSLGISNIRFGRSFVDARYSKTRKEVIAKVHNKSDVRMPIEVGVVLKRNWEGETTLTRDGSTNSGEGIEVRPLGDKYVELSTRLDLTEGEISKITFNLSRLFG